VCIRADDSTDSPISNCSPSGSCNSYCRSLSPSFSWKVTDERVECDSTRTGVLTPRAPRAPRRRGNHRRVCRMRRTTGGFDHLLGGLGVGLRVGGSLGGNVFGRIDGLDRAYRLACSAIDALVRVDIHHAIAFVNAVDRTFFDARLDEKIDTGGIDSLSGTAAFNGVETQIRGTALDAPIRRKEAIIAQRLSESIPHDRMQPHPQPRTTHHSTRSTHSSNGSSRKGAGEGTVHDRAKPRLPVTMTPSRWSRCTTQFPEYVRL